MYGSGSPAVASTAAAMLLAHLTRHFFAASVVGCLSVGGGKCLISPNVLPPSLPCFWPFESAQHTLLFNAIALRSSLALLVKLATHIARAGPNVQFAKNTE